MEEYFQEAGRGGRDGLPAKATIYYNAYVTSKAKRGLQDIMIKFVKSTADWKREIILQYFGYQASNRTDGGHDCCDYHRNICSCELCLSEAKKPKFVTEVDLQSTAPTGSITVSKEQRDLFRQMVLTFRDILRTSRSCVGSVSLSTGFSLGVYKTWTGSDRIGLTKPGPDRTGLTKPGSDCVRLTKPGPDPKKKSDRHKFPPK